ncbi:unnamed protein product [Ambrosiozyma monospora]|uniref:Unnamed protein product n=1 Tax=Ambrosiozyma monospora TaxID=43982 RepID=A0ACB5SW95_AMBMO|nr:unnamed protein product [Ambrosiozyma monospora]
MHVVLQNFIKDVHSLGTDVSNGTYNKEKIQLVSDLSLSLYEGFSKQGQTEAPPAGADVDLHFVCFVKGKNGHVFELDGRRNGPVDLGKESSADADVIDSKLVIDRIQKYMGLSDEKNSLNFALMGLTPSQE